MAAGEYDDSACIIRVWGGTGFPLQSPTRQCRPVFCLPGPYLGRPDPGHILSLPASRISAVRLRCELGMPINKRMPLATGPL